MKMLKSRWNTTIHRDAACISGMRQMSDGCQWRWLIRLTSMRLWWVDFWLRLLRRMRVDENWCYYVDGDLMAYVELAIDLTWERLTLILSLGSCNISQTHFFCLVWSKLSYQIWHCELWWLLAIFCARLAICRIGSSRRRVVGGTDGG